MMQSSALSNQFQFTEQEIGFDHLRQAAFQYIGSEPIPGILVTGSGSGSSSNGLINGAPTPVMPQMV